MIGETNTHPNEEPVPLPSIKDSLMKPKTLLYALIFSAVMNILLLIAVVAVSTTNSSSSPSSPTTTTRPTDTPTVTLRATPRPSFTPDEALVEFQNCFYSCDTKDLLENTRSKALTHLNFKAQIYYQDDQRKTCHGNYLESTDSFKEFNSYQFRECPTGYLSKLPQTSIQISDNIYYLNSSGNWNLDSKTRISQTKLIRVIDEVISQQEKTVEILDTDNLKQISTTSKTVNELNQLVTKSAKLVVNEYLDVISYEVEITNISKESGYFFGVGTQNTIETPI